ncbi:FAD/NAD(P)-binding domain-containing protein [Modestobacter sp. Leaf380]|uniref:FAD/NAD(P)-binding protein n=1 Tax=Modestobacter sp. Leaf380 TaxID=1736356 RepID=UPI0006F44CCD|nr:FAD/NAD(P)-binding protein [Modestobacter sp. Leaf380]KQS68467.1 hypothetical protein ASG41_05710 [Modestobacter sp. Leaf380]
MTSTSPSAVALVGAGPTALGVLERLVGRAAGRPLVVHLVDPHPPGGGRVWRTAQSELLWANSLAADITVLPDASVAVEGRIGAGTTLWHWVEQTGRGLPGDVGVEARRLTATSFPSRRLVNGYLGWVLSTLAASPGVTVHRHATRAVDVLSGPRVVLADGRHLDVDAVVLAQGHLDALPSDAEAELARRAREHGLGFVPTGYTADLDLSALRPGEDVLVRGAGLAFVDLVTLLTGGRGGTYHRDADGRLVYAPSGREPVLHVGSRRGVPYRAKLGYAWAGPPVPLHAFTPDAVTARFGDRPLDLRADLAPILARELEWAHLTELFRAHPDRVREPWEAFAVQWRATEEPAEAAALVARAVPDPADRFDLAALDRPLAGRAFADAGELQGWTRAHVRADLARAADPAYSMDAAVFVALLQCHGTIAALARSGRLTDRSAREDVAGWWMNLFSYLASGPPSPRLEELLALSEAGVVRFTGADTAVTLEDGAWVARSVSVPGTTSGTALVEARVPAVDVERTTDELVRRLLVRGVAAEQPGTGRLHVDAGHRLVSALGEPAADVFAAGFWTSGAPVAAFARPGTNAPFFGQNDVLAAGVWAALDRVSRVAAA